MLQHERTLDNKCDITSGEGLCLPDLFNFHFCKDARIAWCHCSPLLLTLFVGHTGSYYRERDICCYTFRQVCCCLAVIAQQCSEDGAVTLVDGETANQSGVRGRVEICINITPTAEIKRAH